MDDEIQLYVWKVEAVFKVDGVIHSKTLNIPAETAKGAVARLVECNCPTELSARVRREGSPLKKSRWYRLPPRPECVIKSSKIDHMEAVNRMK